MWPGESVANSILFVALNRRENRRVRPPIIEAVVSRILSSRTWAVCAAWLVLAALASHLPAVAQPGPEAQNAGGGRILLVLPFDNRTGQPNLEWVREAAPEILSSRFTSAGFAPLSRA